MGSFGFGLLVLMVVVVGLQVVHAQDIVFPGNGKWEAECRTMVDCKSCSGSSLVTVCEGGFCGCRFGYNLRKLRQKQYFQQRQKSDLS